MPRDVAPGDGCGGGDTTSEVTTLACVLDPTPARVWADATCPRAIAPPPGAGAPTTAPPDTPATGVGVAAACSVSSSEAQPARAPASRSVPRAAPAIESAVRDAISMTFLLHRVSL